ncbi:MAG: hypothetical protein IJN16_01245 [Lachnospiraceae bacterium]|nr:hypothetical protein [Lachnospiraceae bacterium]
MKRKIFTLITVLSLCCLSACATETKDNVATNNKNDIAVESIDNEPTAKPVVEATVEPTEEPVEEVTPAPTTEPTEEPSVVYEGIDMVSDLPGEEWVETFVGIIDEPKIVVFSDETGRKEIIEEEAIVKINPEEDVIAVYLPDGYKKSNRIKGINQKQEAIKEHSIIFFLDVEVTREKKVQIAAIYVENNGEEIALNFTLVPIE